jgi:hypothetical protein|tara:strand:+ start:206 stop:487 length:282 start_codon:yes stop_codon:yes gene_type:complete
VTTSSRKSYNHLALRGVQVGDDEFISDWNSNPLTKTSLESELAFTKELMPRVIDIGIAEDLEGGVLNDKEARKRKQDQMKEYRELLAKKGMLK